MIEGEELFNVQSDSRKVDGFEVGDPVGCNEGGKLGNEIGW